MQVRIQRFLENTRRLNGKQTLADSEDGRNNDKEKMRKRMNDLIRRKRMKEVQLLLKKEEFSPWGRDVQAKVCVCVYVQVIIFVFFI